MSGQVEGEGLVRGNQSQCRMRKRIIFAKTHKTGSTTLQNIFHRSARPHQCSHPGYYRDTEERLYHVQVR